MRRKIIITVIALLASLMAIPTASAAQVMEGIVDFETPALGSQARLVIDPYVDEGAGVTFTADPLPVSSSGVVEVIKNSATSACTEPSNDDQLLGTRWPGPANFGTYPIRGTFTNELQPPVSVSVDVQTLAGSIARIRLFDSSGNVVSRSTATASNDLGTCGKPGSARSSVTVTATSESAVAYAVVDLAKSWGTVFVIDDFTYEAASPSPRADGAEVTKTDFDQTYWTKTRFPCGDVHGWGEVIKWNFDVRIQYRSVIDPTGARHVVNPVFTHAIGTGTDTGTIYRLNEVRTFNINQSGEMFNNIVTGHTTIVGQGGNRYKADLVIHWVFPPGGGEPTGVNVSSTRCESS